MTAEIAILNKSAIALAADSKVTLSYGNRRKTYDTVDKLFSLSKIAPMGAMIYGNAEFIGFPWETIIKNYRRNRPHVAFDTVFEWSEDLLQYLKTFFDFREVDEDRTALSIAQAWSQQVVQQAMDTATSPEQFETLVLDGCNANIAELRNTEDFLTDAEWLELRGRISTELVQICSVGPAGQMERLQGSLLELARLGICKKFRSPSSSGLVVAGFGEKELLPSLISFDIDGIIAGRLKCVEGNRYDTTRRDRGTIIPFAQTDMVYRFMEGIDPDYAMTVFGSVETLLLDNAKITARLLGHSEEDIAQMTDAFARAAGSAVTSFWEVHERVRREQFSSPIIDMAASLPKDELANLAESLVSLTSLQRRVSRDIETVGGAIDVAVISKGDGFVWIKRKHYFEAERNLRFVHSYFSEHNAPGNRGGRNDNDA